ncbi:hypothetical protein BASA81_008372 [Batrachochytrium salamandrivorans]|nr:hypothetical protein BASA81_008372 [Batrachochytrium salamandrivorans]
MSPTVSVKWNKQIFPSVELPATSNEFKAQLRALTGVREDRMNLLCLKLWKGALGNDVDLTTLEVPSNTTVVLMGTASEEAAPPPANVVFLEDTLVNSATTGSNQLPAGLHNLGNTCYLNSVVQLVRASPELGLEIAQSTQTGREGLLVGELRNLMHELKTTKSLEVVPLRFVNVVRQLMPRFNERNARQEFVQQDADEFYNELLTQIKPQAQESFSIECNLQFEGESEVKRDVMWRLQCMINTQVDHLTQGLKLGMESTVERFSPTLGCNTSYKQLRTIAKLPKNLTIQLNRFFWKLTPESADHRGVNCKILRSVKFPEFLDVYEFCNKKLQAKLSANREIKLHSTSTPKTEEEDELEKALKMSMEEEEEPTTTTTNVIVEEEEDMGDLFGKDVPETFTGRYELYAVVSHKGRSATSGHYMAWVKNDGSGEKPTQKRKKGAAAALSKWTCFDDDHPSECTWKEVEQLSGGGDHHMAFMLLYRAVGSKD